MNEPRDDLFHDDLPDDPVYRHARREAILVLVVWCLCGIYTLTYCFLNAYGRDPAELETYLGIPDWILFGIICPWILADIFAWWFCFRFIRDEDLGEEPEEEEWATGATAGAASALDDDRRPPSDAS